MVTEQGGTERKPWSVPVSLWILVETIYPELEGTTAEVADQCQQVGAEVCIV